MEPFDLPPELKSLEQRLAGRGRPAPSTDHKARVLGRVSRELAARRAWWRRPGGWRFAAAAAAALVLGMNLALFTSADAGPLAVRDGRAAAIDQAAARIEGLVPGLGPREARREAILLVGASDLVMMPRPASADAIRNLLDTRKEVLPWVTP